MSYRYSICVAINIVGSLFLVYTGLASAISILNNGLLAHAPLTFLWGSYSPASVAALESVIVYFAFYKKFWPKNIFLFMFIFGASDLVFNLVYDLYHLPQLLTGPQPWQMGSNYLEIMTIEGVIGLIGYVLLRPNFRFERSYVIYFSLVLFVGGYLYSFATGYQVTSDPKYTASLVLYFLEFVETATALILIYTSTHIDEPPAKLDML